MPKRLTLRPLGTGRTMSLGVGTARRILGDTARIVALTGILAALTAPVAAPQSSAAQPADPPALDLVLTPRASGANGVDRIDVRMRIQAPDLAAGATLLRMPILTNGIPTAAYEANAIGVSDANGPLQLKQVDEPPVQAGTYRHWEVDRATSGDVVVTYGTGYRSVDRLTPSGPHLDLWAQGGGLIGSGNYFFALPPPQTRYRISMHWNLSKAPARTRAVWSLGEGDRTVVESPRILASTYYAVGPVGSEPADGRGKFVFYWLVRPTPAVWSEVTSMKPLFAYMSGFFKDPGADYRIFVRPNPFPGGGGTGSTHAFMFGYGTDGRGATASYTIQQFLAHEMVHSWPRLEGGERFETGWYGEGIAEYYSALLLHRSGLIGLEEFRKISNLHAAVYYMSAFMNTPLADVGKQKDSRAGRVVYSRGFMYLVQVDAKLRAKSGGTRSLDDVAFEILELQKQPKKPGLADWIRIITRELGDEGRQDFDDMMAGKTIVPVQGTLGSCFMPVRTERPPFELGFEQGHLAAVSGLRPGSAAADAGVHEGDDILSMTKISDVEADSARPMELTVRRGTDTLKVSYKPKGPSVATWQWVRNPRVPAADCKL